jgi:hypothetical protein
LPTSSMRCASILGSSVSAWGKIKIISDSVPEMTPLNFELLSAI